jgi:sensor histidine kinase YesM
MCIVTYFAWGFGFKDNPKRSFLNAMTFLPGHLLMVYTLLYFLAPRYLLQRKFIHFFIGFFIVLALCILYTILTQLSIGNARDFKGANLLVGRNILPFIHVGGIALSIKMLKFWFIQRKYTVEAEQQKTMTELKLLRAQLHPHFLFNTLDNLYEHTRISSPNSQEIVLKLSALLRFMIYESNVPKIPLSKEVEYMNNYIALEKLRFGSRLDVSVSLTGDIEKYQIAPLLLLPFLEKAFKYGTMQGIDQCWMSLDLSMEGSLMKFKLLNGIDPDNKEEGNTNGSSGFENVKRRLEELYKDKYNFETIRLEEVFIVNLDVLLEELEIQYKEKLF